MAYLTLEFEKLLKPAQLEEILILSCESIGWNHKMKSNSQEIFNEKSKKIEKVHKDYNFVCSGSFLPMATITLPKRHQNWIGICYGFGSGFATSKEFNNFLDKVSQYSKLY